MNFDFGFEIVMLINDVGRIMEIKAYIPLQGKTTAIRASRWVSPPTRKLALGCWYLKTLKFALPPT